MVYREQKAPEEEDPESEVAAVDRAARTTSGHGLSVGAFKKSLTQIDRTVERPCDLTQVGAAAAWAAASPVHTSAASCSVRAMLKVRSRSSTAASDSPSTSSIVRNFRRRRRRCRRCGRLASLTTSPTFHLFAMLTSLANVRPALKPECANPPSGAHGHASSK